VTRACVRNLEIVKEPKELLLLSNS
jgi:hypothetical protein